jgi:uncharacterized protein (DUF697 family)
VKASEVNAAIEGDLQAFAKCLKACKAVYDHQDIYPAVIGIPTQCDLLAPPHSDFWTRQWRDYYARFWDPEGSRLSAPESNADYVYAREKLENIQKAVVTWRERLESMPVSLRKGDIKVIPTAAEMRFRSDGTPDPDPRTDQRWNIDALKALMFGELPKEAQIQFFRLARVRFAQHKFAQKINQATSAAATVVGAVPIPIADFPILLGIQILQVAAIAYASGRRLSWDTAGEFLAAMGFQTGAGLVLREGFRALAKLVPGAGWLIGGGIAGGATLLSGRLAEEYFIEGNNVALAEAIRKAKAQARGTMGGSQ